MKEVPKIIDEMQKVKDIVTNYILLYKLIDDEEFDRLYNQLNSISSTAASIQKETFKKVVSKINSDLDDLLDEIIKKKYYTKNLFLHTQISNDEIGISCIGKNLFYEKNENFYLIAENLLQQQEMIKEDFSKYITDICNKLSNYIDNLSKDKDIEYVISFAKNYNLNAHEIKINGNYKGNEHSVLIKTIEDFLQLSIHDLVLDTTIISISKDEIDKNKIELETKKEFNNLNLTLSRLETIIGKDLDKFKDLNRKLDLLIKEYGGNI